MTQFVNSSGVPAEAQPGQSITAITEYNGSGSNGPYVFLLKIGGTQWSAGETGNYNGGTAEEIAERTSKNGTPTPLLNFQSITISGYNGRGLGKLPSDASEWTMPGYDTVSGVSNGTFTVTQNHCNG